uniref:Uncharacterized protein LOC114349522 n=1 Tax=Diabrotica virgifera virgifera TaxID=50390 RepID=A0A6P7HDP4_DIAVI
MSKLDLILDVLVSEGKAIILTGDFNIDFKSNSLSKQNLVNVLDSYGLTVTVNDYTRVTATSKTQIDYIATNINHQQKTMVVEGFISDHRAQLFQCSINTDNDAYIFIRSYSERNINRFVQTLESTNWSEVFNTISAEDKSLAFLNTIQNYFRSHFPLLKCKPKKCTRSNWFTQELYNLRDQLKLLETICQQNSNLRPVHHLAKREYSIKLKAAKSSHFMRQLNESSNKMKCIWHLVNLTVGKQNNSKVPSDDNNNLADKFNHHFVEMAPKLLAALDPTKIGGFTSASKNRNSCSMFLYPTNPQEITSIVGSFKSKHSCGFDQISPKLLKQCIHAFADPLTDICNASFQQGIFPSMFKLSIVISLFKSGDKDDLNNYRPISLLSVFSKDN